jgi:hypothetical protein
MIVTLHTQGLQTLAQIRAFVEGNEPVSFTLADRTAAYAWMADTLKRFQYRHGLRADKGLLRRYLAKVTGLSRAQVERVIRQFLSSGSIKDRRRAPTKPFATRYTAEDIHLLAEVDALHDTLSGPATRKLCERMVLVFGDARYQRLAGISNGHLYNLRRHKTYLRLRHVVQKTRPVQVRIGERRKPAPGGLPGYQCLFAVARISEHYLLPVLHPLQDAFPFVIRGFHSDNGSEYINHQVAKLLEKLRIEQTQSRSRQTNDNALVESKNGSTIRQHLGYSHIPGPYAEQVNAVTRDVLSPYINFHRPCFFPTAYTDAKGRLRKRYRYQDMMTPYDKLKSLPEAHTHLKPGIRFEDLDAIAFQCSDNEAAFHLKQAKVALFQLINQSRTSAA